MASKIVSTRKTVNVRNDGGLRLAVVADTHSLPHEATLPLLRELKPDGILHAGDIGDLSVLESLKTVAPLYVVRGNIDTHAARLPDELTLDIEGQGQTLLRLFLVHIGVAGPRIRGDVSRKARGERAGLVVCGHSHVPFIGQDKGLAVFNPGSVGPRRFHLPIVFGVIELSPKGVSLRHISAETGREWLPPGPVPIC
jgi:putative phosphoesterase